jgi:hypothetical protein
MEDPGHDRARAPVEVAGGGVMTVDEMIAAADKMVSDLCDGSRRWLMSIPARPDDDPDLVIGRALHEASKEITQLRAEITQLRADLEALVPLARVGAWAIQEMKKYHGDLNGGDVQDKAVEFGALVAEPVGEPCAEEGCVCAEFGFPMWCYRYSQAATDALAFLIVLDAKTREVA